jgi:membrane-associated phospholipid phosphatase
MRFPSRRHRELARLIGKLTAWVGMLALALSGSAASARAESPYETHRSQEWVWLGTGLALSAGGFFAAHNIDPLTPAEIAALSTDDINSFDRNTMSPYRADHAGDVLAISSFLFPIAFLANDDMRNDAGTLGVMWLEATAWTEGVAQVTKTLAKRTRPYVYDPDAPDRLKTQKEARLSFYSAHATSAAMNCFFMAKVFSDYSDNRNAEVAMWTGAVLYPALTGFFRVDSGHHFTTDAIVGVVTGAAVGYLVPALHHRDDGVSVEPQSGGGGAGFSVTFSF